MEVTTILFVLFFALLVWFFATNCPENFYIEPNTIAGGSFQQVQLVKESDGQERAYNTPLELEGPGNAAWSGY